MRQDEKRREEKEEVIASIYKRWAPVGMVIFCVYRGLSYKDMKRDSFNLKILWLAISAYTFYFSFLSILKLVSFSYYDFDLAVHTLSVWNITHGSIYNSILGIPFLGNHMQPILFFVAPLFALYPHPETLLLLQTLFLSLGAFPLYLIAKKRIGTDLALIVALGYLLYPGLAFTNLFEFHPTVFATFFLILSLYAYDFEKIKLFIFSSVLAMLSQENVPMAIITLGVMAFIEKKGLKWIFIPIVLGVVYFIPALILMGHFNQGTVQFFSLYRHLGQNHLGIFLHPWVPLRFILRQESFVYLFNIFLPVLFIPFMALIKLFPAAPFFLQHLLSARPYDLNMSYHYLAEIIPFVFFSAIYGINKLIKMRFFNRHIPVFKSILISFILFNAVYYGPYVKESFRINGDFRKDYLDLYKERFIDKIPHSANVVATFEFLPRLANRKKLYSLHHSYKGFYTLSDKRYILPEDAEYALVDFNDRFTFREFYIPDSYANLKNIFLKYEWELIDMVDSLVILRKSSKKQDFICAKVDSIRDNRNKETIKVGESFVLKSAHFIRIPGKEMIEATLYWKSIKKTKLDIQLFISITDSKGRIIKRLMHPICYRIFPTQSWQEGEIYKDLLRIYIPEEYLKDDIVIMAGFYDYLTGNIVKLKVDGESYDLAGIGSLKCKK
ncbi:MAG: DUF2079 domain-containing protein [Candidatus Omnitrophota bacterium]|jgi:uncharacterized membrane protein